MVSGPSDEIRQVYNYLSPELTAQAARLAQYTTKRFCEQTPPFDLDGRLELTRQTRQSEQVPDVTREEAELYDTPACAEPLLRRAAGISRLSQPALVMAATPFCRFTSHRAQQTDRKVAQ